MTLVVSQPMLWPWKGLFEQAAASDIFVHYDDVQLPNGRSFMTRVQLKSPGEPLWLSIPVQRKSYQLIRDVRISYQENWMDRHLKTLQQLYAKATHKTEMLDFVSEAYRHRPEFLVDLTIPCFERLSARLGIETQFMKSSELGVGESSSQKLFEISKKLNASRYLTGHGAFSYLDHGLFNEHGVQVDYMNYQHREYPQAHGGFTPFVSILDLIANVGFDVKDYLISQTVPWQEFAKNRMKEEGDKNE